MEATTPWRDTAHLPSLFPNDPLLARSAAAHPRAQLRRTPDGFALAFPLDPSQPFPLLPLFCFARLERWPTGPHIIYWFHPDGTPIMG